MEERFSLDGGRGVLTVREEGGRAVCRAELRDDGRGLYKAWLRGSAGGRVPLGTLIPENGMLRLTRTLSVDDLAAKKAWPVRDWGAELAFAPRRGASPAQPPPGWQREEQPGRLLGDPALARAAQGLGHALLRREGEGFRLAAPWMAGERFPLPVLFCFASVEELGGRQWAVFTFNRHGCPVFRNKTAEMRDTVCAKLEKE